MEVEKKSSKGGFLSFFDWGGKSRKKLFPSNTSVELDGNEKVNENVDEPVSRFRLVEYDENRGSMKFKGNGESNLALSTSSDDGHRTGAPSVVARLMGLDTLPNVNVNGTCSSQNMDSHSLTDGCIPGSSLISRFEGFYLKDQNFLYNQDGFYRAPVAMTPQKMPGRPIERFQSETMPPRSAKTIPITHHKLLSPIKSPRFIPTKNAVYIMEAASRMIDPNPRTDINGRMSAHSSSSVPLRIRDLKDRMEASQKSLRLQKPKESVIRSNVNRKEVRTLNGSVDVSRAKAPLNSVRSSSESSRSRGKVELLTEIVKSDTQRREGIVPSGMRNSTSHRVVSEAMSKQTVKRSQQVIQRTELPRTVAVRTSRVLKQNNQKQNNTQSENSSTSNSSVPNRLKKKIVPTNDSLKTDKTARRSSTDDQTRSRKDVTNTEIKKQYPVSKGMKSRQHTKTKNGTSQSADLMSETVLVSKDGKSIQCNAVVDGGSSWASSNNKDCMDVISFTFSSPIKKHAPNAEDNVRVMGSSQASGECSQNSHNTKMVTLSPQRFNRMGPDALGILLEQKLKELTCRIDSSSGTFNESHETRFQDSLHSSNVPKTSSEEHNSTFCKAGENSDSFTEQESNIYDLLQSSNKRPQEIEDCYSVSKKNDSNKKLETGLDSFSYAEDSPSNDGWCSSSENSCSVQEVTMCEVTNTLSSESNNYTECEIDSLEASSWKLSASYDCLLNYPSMAGWESKYLRDIISHAELRVNHYLLGQVEDVIDSNFFNQLENQPHLSESSKIERRLLFDCISELMNHKCEQLTSGCSRILSKFASSSYQSEYFSLELYREISSLKNMEGLMVDEVVDRDMSSGIGKWVDFDVEASEECIELEKLILSSLVDELVADLVK